MPRPVPSIALRLTLWYAAVFAATSLFALGFVYATVRGVLFADLERELRLDLAETAALVDSAGVDGFRRELGRELSGPDSAVTFLRLWSPDGRVLASAGFGSPGDAVRRALPIAAVGRDPASWTASRTGGDERVRVGLVRTAAGFAVELGQGLHAVEDLLGMLRTALLVALPVMLVLGVPIGWFMARRALRGVDVMTRTALEIAGGAIDRRVPVGPRGDELDRLGLAFNGMLDRIQALIRGMRDMTDDLAHDLRTPLARVRAAAERAATREASREEWVTLAGTTVEECDRLLEILNGTLELAEAEAGASALRREALDLGRVANDAAELFATLAEDAGLVLEVSAPEGVVVQADRSRVQRIVANLLDNAIKFTPRGGRIAISVEPEGAGARLVVRDTGPGIGPDELPRIFERFYRGDGSRTGRGAGLGLSLARAFARAHGGDLVASSASGQGSTFTLRLPR